MIVTILSNLDAESVRQFEWDGIIDFTDMLYLTYHKIVNGEWKVPYWGYYHNIILDEAQDNNILQVSFLKLIKDKDGRYNFFDGGGACGTFKMTKNFIIQREIKITNK